MSETNSGEMLMMSSAPNLVCITCLGEWKQSQQDAPEGTPIEPLPVNQALTLVAQWETKAVAGQVMMACISVLTCEKHITVAPRSAVEQAMQGGVLIPGAGG